MTHSMADAGKRIMAALAAVITAGILLFGCSIPAYARQDQGWGGSSNVNTRQTGKYYSDEDEQDSDNNNADSAGNDEESGDESSGEENTGTGDIIAETGFSTPGNGNLGDQIKNSNGKDFFTVRTKNNNTFYLVIDHANSTENVYMLSLIDEDDLAEFLEETQKKEEKTTAPVIIPESKPQTETPEKENKTEQPATQAPYQNTFFWIACAAAAGIGAFLYFKVYKPGKEDRDLDDSEGMETMADDFPTE